jgi:hypothetical protein
MDKWKKHWLKTYRMMKRTNKEVTYQEAMEEAAKTYKQ